MQVGDIIIDGSSQFILKHQHVGLPLGHIYFSFEKEVPVGSLPALGALYDRDLYKDLWDYANDRGLVLTEAEWQNQASANDGNVPWYSDGDGSTTFRVPKLPTTIASDVPSEVPVVGNGMTLGLTTGSQNCGIIGDYGNYGSCAFPNVYGTSVGASPTGSVTSPNKSLGITTDPAKSGIIAQTSSTKITGQWLIVAFGVAHNIGEADVANVMQAIETAQTSIQTVDNKITGISDYIIESYRSGTEWYEIYKSGKVRQGGFIGDSEFSTTATGNNQVITFLKPFANTKYYVNVALVTNYTNIDNGQWIVWSKTTTGCTTKYTCAKYWAAEGQGA